MYFLFCCQVVKAARVLPKTLAASIASRRNSSKGPNSFRAFGIFGLGVSVIGPIGISMVGHLVRPHLRTEAISRVAVIGFSGFFFAPMLMGLVSEAFGLRIAFLCVAGVILCAVPLVLVAARLPKIGTASTPAAV